MKLMSWFEMSIETSGMSIRLASIEGLVGSAGVGVIGAPDHVDASLGILGQHGRDDGRDRALGIGGVGRPEDTSSVLISPASSYFL